MEFTIDQRQPVRESVGSMELSSLWLHWATVHHGPPPEPRGRPSSYWAECECPDDCLRDHENE
jgi:hypothetical protein